MNECRNCGKETTNPKYCSRSCSATVNGSKYPKRVAKRRCPTCQVAVSSKRATYCSIECNPTRVDWSKVTLGDVKDRAKYQVSARVRQIARLAMMRSGRERACAACGYDLHVEVSHITPISSFSDDAHISDVNSLDNMEYLCPTVTGSLRISVNAEPGLSTEL